MFGISPKKAPNEVKWLGFKYFSIRFSSPTNPCFLTFDTKTSIFAEK